MFVVVGVTGGIAAYKSVQLVRLLVKDGHDVHVVPTDDALRFVGLPTWEAISRNPVTTSVHDDVASVRHVSLGQRADLVVIAPATANTMAKMAAGIAEDLLGTTLLATRAPVLIAPAMHTEMWQHPATQANVETLISRGVHMIGPVSGELTGGDSGQGRMAEPELIHESVTRELLRGTGEAIGQHWLVSAGGTREPLDPVRFIGNRSSGKQGVEVALAAARHGANVTLLAANISQQILAPAQRDPRIRIVETPSAEDLEHAVREYGPDAGVIVMAAAVADYRTPQKSATKITKESADAPVLRLELVETPDILAGLVERRSAGQTLVGFAAETPSEGETLVQRAVAKRRRKGADLLAANEVGWSRGFEQDDNHLIVIDVDDEVVADVAGTKRETADALVAVILGHISAP
ncbi:bifunctional phosphopantothenoylcysteine decarboxylase/phosphopantothenate--cysteine ligase CoaBC [Microbacterium amylolyticum]|uniref:Coenzyme A biosynthesis bifunctional protein CoaBC n=1 Tax=Microbacterium amylolyticum TaxID=936337 RepID=A0ABS4ZGC9_9MICO|nr:bifunctional phosphopantothenoylcysteine decarboxylase/phosphopantothenate--cysteine ligase CoaBC [Microbacterium amylolyticum]MBP2436330.1 phosphopantothenoylcysteine decarboxylase/phosphopantothenate--cysteine ligase [Microbacterium amylolyticum]